MLEMRSIQKIFFPFTWSWARFALAMMFFTRIRLPGVRHSDSLKLTDCAVFFTLVGVIVGVVSAGTYLIMLFLGASHGVAAALALMAQVWLTMGLHEDGLADTADGMAFSRTMAEKLAIMRDSRIGAYGVLALVLVLGLKQQAIAAFPADSQIVAASILAGAASRFSLAVLMLALPMARENGLAANAGAVTRGQVLAGAMITLALGLLLASSHLLLIVLSVALLTIALMARLAKRHFGGITGDVLGAAQMLCETSILALTSFAITGQF